MHIRYVINSLDGGGAALPLADVISVMHAHGHDVRVSGLCRKDGRACTRLDAAGIPYEILGPNHCATPVVAARLWRRLNHDKPDLIWTSVTRATLLGQIYGRVLDIPVVSWLHNAFLRPHKKAALRRSKEFTSHWVVDCQATADFAVAEVGIPRDRISVWPLFIADSHHPTAAPWPGSGPFRVGSLGRLHRNKRYDTLLHAAARIRERDPTLASRLEFLIGGVGPQRRPLEKLIRAHGLTNVRLTGFQEDAPAFLASLHAYVQPSHHEGLCVAAHQALLAGLPVVSTAVGELPRSVGYNGERGRLCKVDDPESLADVLVTMAHAPDKATRMGRDARAYIMDTYSADAFRQRGHSVLTKVAQTMDLARTHPG